MRDAGYTKQERQLLTLLRIWTVVFLGTGVVFVVAPDAVIRYIEMVGRGIFHWKHAPLQLGTERFWLVLASSLMATLTFLSYKAQSNLLRNILYTSVILIAKFVSTVGFLVCFIFAENSFVYLTGAIVDGTIFLITAMLYHSALKSRSRL